MTHLHLATIVMLAFSVFSFTMISDAYAQTPSVPLIVNPVEQSSTQIDIFWNASADGTPSSYNLYASLTADGTQLPGFPLNLSSTGASEVYSHTGLIPDTTYFYQVSALNSFGEGELSNVQATVTLANEDGNIILVSDESSCVNDIDAETEWTDPDTCTLLEDEEFETESELVIDSGIIFVVQTGAIIMSDGTITNLGTLDNYGFVSAELIFNSGIDSIFINNVNAEVVVSDTFSNEGILNNYGVAALEDSLINTGTISNEVGGDLETDLDFENSGTIINSGVISNEDNISIDLDNDDLFDTDEVNIYGTDPANPDTDGDGMSDGDEVSVGTDPLNSDTDGDTLIDNDEVYLYFTDPLNSDTDGDTLFDSDEINTYLTDPLNSDTDSDGLSDGDEINTYLTDPLNSDTDGDGLSDGDEINTYLTDPLNSDTDSDGISDIIDTQPTSPSNSFDDRSLGGTTYGQIVANLDQDLSIIDEENPLGVRIIAGPGGITPAIITVCDDISQVVIVANSEVIVTCGSVTWNVVSGMVDATLVSAKGDTVQVSIDAGSELYFDDEIFKLESTIGTAEITLVTEYGITTEVTLTQDTSIIVEPETTTIITPVENTVPISIVTDGNKIELSPGETKDVLSPKIIKESALESIEELLMQDIDKKTKKNLTKSIKSLQRSLDNSLWADDTHLDIKYGKKVFHEEKKTVKDLSKIKSLDVSNIIEMLVGADKKLVTIILSDAQVFAGDKKADKQLEKADKEIAKAEKALGKENFEKAIKHYEKAWKHAIKAMGHSISDGDEDDD